jgi:hypothetical protein
METTAVSPAEIDAFLADECGLEYYEAGWGRAEACIQDENQDGWNLFTESLDALFAPGGPVSKVRELGLHVQLLDWDGGFRGAAINDVDEVRVVFIQSTPALAIAQTCYRVLKGW